MTGHLKSFELGEDMRGSITDAYLLLMLLVFPLFTGLSGYENLTFSKFVFFIGLTAVWLASLAVLSIRGRRGPGRFGAAGCFAMIFILLACLSAAMSEYGAACIVGGGRYDGLLSWLAYALVFVGVSTFGSFKRCHAAAFGVSVSICCVTAILQLFGKNPLGLFPADYCYYDAHIKFTSEFLGTIGNVNLLASLLCLAIPFFFAFSVIFEGIYSALSLIPLFLAVTVLAASGVSGGAFACAATALVALPLLFSDGQRVLRGCISLCVCALALAAAFSIDGGYVEGELAISVSPGTRSKLCLVLAAVLMALRPVLRRTRLNAGKCRLRAFFTILSAAALLAAFAAVWLYRGDSGTVYELSQLLHGHADDSFGSSRIRIWRETLALIPEHPLLGTGPGTLALRLDIEFSRFVPETGKTLFSYVDNAHNEYLQILAETGAMGLAAYLCIIVCSLRQAMKNGGGAGASIFLAVFCCCVQGFFGLGLCITAPLLWIFLGFAAAYGAHPSTDFLGGMHD